MGKEVRVGNWYRHSKYTFEVTELGADFIEFKWANGEKAYIPRDRFDQLPFERFYSFNEYYLQINNKIND